MKNIIDDIFMNIGVWCISRFFNRIIFFTDTKKDRVTTLVFTNNKKFIKYCDKYEK